VEEPLPSNGERTREFRRRDEIGPKKTRKRVPYRKQNTLNPWGGKGGDGTTYSRESINQDVTAGKKLLILRDGAGKQVKTSCIEKGRSKAGHGRR